MRKIINITTCLTIALTALVGCAQKPQQEVVDQAKPTVLSYFPQSSDKVSLTNGTFSLKQWQNRINANGDLVSFDKTQFETLTFDTWIIENQYIKATVLPGYGGRVISLIDKDTGHEQLYQNPLATPYALNQGNFMFDWLQVWGGIFPTFGPEHGKAWFVPWDLTIESQSDRSITLKMTWVDDETKSVPPRFQPYAKASGLVLNYYVTLSAGRKALDTKIEIVNSTDKNHKYEYWTNVAMAPGSEPGNPKATAGAEIIYPLEVVSTSWCRVNYNCRKTISVEERVKGGKIKFNKLRHFKNWSHWGIMYAEPDMQGKNFWGVINHDNEEGLIRIADNSFTEGMKFWAFGYDTSKDIDPYTDTSADYYFRPFIELWAGNVSEFFKLDQIQAGVVESQNETYAPTVGLPGISAANENFLAFVQANGTHINAQIQALFPNQDYTIKLIQGSQSKPELIQWNQASTESKSFEFEYNPDAGQPILEIYSSEDQLLFQSALSFD